MADVPALDMVGLVEKLRFLAVEKPAFLRDWKRMRMNGRMERVQSVGQTKYEERSMLYRRILLGIQL